MNAIEVKGLSKNYGKVKAVDGLDLVVPEGSVYGFLGPNGAGKTTTFKMLTGLIKPTTGEISFFGKPFSFGDVDKQTAFGYLPDVPGFYKWMNAREFLRFSGQLYKLNKKTLESRIDELLELVGLTDVNKRISTYSRGMKQRLGIAQALIHDPKIIFLDEPVSALDPIGRKDVMEIIEKLKGKATVLFSTHIISDIERICDHVLILNKGKLELQDSLENIAKSFPIHSIMVQIDTKHVKTFAENVKQKDWLGQIWDYGGGKVVMNINDMDKAQLDIPRILSNQNIPLRKLETAEPSLEEVFLKVVNEE